MYKEGDACCQKLSIVKVSKVLPGSPTDSNITFSTLGAVSFRRHLFFTCCYLNRDTGIPWSERVQESKSNSPPFKIFKVLEICEAYGPTSSSQTWT